MPENEKETGIALAQDHLTTAHVEKGLTTVHLRQQLEAAAPPPVSPSTVTPAPIPPTTSNGDKRSS